MLRHRSCIGDRHGLEIFPEAASSNFWTTRQVPFLSYSDQQPSTSQLDPRTSSFHTTSNTRNPIRHTGLPRLTPPQNDKLPNHHNLRHSMPVVLRWQETSRIRHRCLPSQTPFTQHRHLRHNLEALLSQPLRRRIPRQANRLRNEIWRRTHKSHAEHVEQNRR